MPSQFENAPQPIFWQLEHLLPDLAKWLVVSGNFELPKLTATCSISLTAGTFENRRGLWHYEENFLRFYSSFDGAWNGGRLRNG